MEQTVRQGSLPQRRSKVAEQANPAPVSTKMLVTAIAVGLPDNGLNTASHKPIPSNNTSAATNINGNHKGMGTIARTGDGDSAVAWLTGSFGTVAGSPRISTPTPRPGRQTGDCPAGSSSKPLKPFPKPEVAMWR
jgi:hypothetical protein